MRCLAALAALALAAVPALAEPKAKPAAATSGTKTAEPAKCKRKVVGRGLDRKVVCELEEPIVVGVEPSKPKVLIAPGDPRRVVGRPKQTDPFAGLPQRRSSAL